MRDMGDQNTSSRKTSDAQRSRFNPKEPRITSARIETLLRPDHHDREFPTSPTAGNQ